MVQGGLTQSTSSFSLIEPIPTRGEEATTLGPYTVTNDVADCGTFQALRPLLEAGTAGIVDLTMLEADATDATPVPSWTVACDFRQYGEPVLGSNEILISQAGVIQVNNPSGLIRFVQKTNEFGMDYTEAKAKAYFWNTGSSCIVSFETVDMSVIGGEINAQIELYPNGDFDIRWGSFEIGSAGLDTAGITSSDTSGDRPPAPAIGPGFDSDGVSFGASTLDALIGSTTNTLDKVQNTCNAFFSKRV